MALLRIKNDGCPDICVSFVFKNKQQRWSADITLCKLVIREDREDAPIFTFWGRTKREKNAYPGQLASLNKAIDSTVTWQRDQCVSCNILNEVFNHYQSIRDRFEECWRKSLSGPQWKRRKRT